VFTIFFAIAIERGVGHSSSRMWVSQ
jgi:hypothetical protein